MSLSAVLKRLGYSQYTVHGFRSTFRDWAAEETHHSSEVVEMAMAHSVSATARYGFQSKVTDRLSRVRLATSPSLPAPQDIRMTNL